MTDLFTYPPAGIAEGKTDTSRAAAEAVRPTAQRVRDKVLALLRDHPAGLTTEEISGHLRIQYHTVQPRTTELRLAGKIEDSGRRRPNGSGRQAIVWRVKE